MLLAFVVLVPSVCYAWGVEGHKIIAEIASRNLDPKAAAAVKAILGDDSIVDVCTWADQIRKEPKYIFTDGCHGASIPVGADGFEMERDCPNGRCAPAAIAKYAAIVRDANASATERLDALKFVIHFAGDIHCPVHAPYTKGQGDVAGQVTFFGEKVSLHKVWDASLILRAGKPWEKYADDLYRDIRPSQRDKWATVTDPGEWATESHRAFVKHAAVSPADSALGQEYYERNIPVVNERLKMGGVRLAAFLNNLLGEAAATRPAAPAATTRPG